MFGIIGIVGRLERLELATIWLGGLNQGAALKRLNRFERVLVSTSNVDPRTSNRRKLLELLNRILR
jgi:hypothetical protein